MHRPHWQFVQPLQASRVVTQVRMIGIFDQRPVVDDVAAEQGLGFGFPQADAAGRVAGGVEDFEYAVAQVEHVAFIDEPCGGCGFDLVFGVAQWAVGVGFEHVVADVCIGQGRCSCGVGEDVGFGRVYQALGELVVPGDVVEVGVAGHGEQRSVGEPGQLLAQADHAGAGVDQHVAVTALNMPEVAAVIRAHQRLVDQADAIGALLYFKPLVTGDDFHGSTLRLPGIALSALGEIVRCGP